MSEVPKALMIAGLLQDGLYLTDLSLRKTAAAELRRLHEVNQELVEAFEKYTTTPRWSDAHEEALKKGKAAIAKAREER